VLKGLATAFSENCLLGYLSGASATGIASSRVGGEGEGVSKSLLPAADLELDSWERVDGRVRGFEMKAHNSLIAFARSYESTGKPDSSYQVEYVFQLD